jgi:hypothetical protein
MTEGGKFGAIVAARAWTFPSLCLADPLHPPSDQGRLLDFHKADEMLNTECGFVLGVPFHAESETN